MRKENKVYTRRNIVVTGVVSGVAGFILGMIGMNAINVKLHQLAVDEDDDIDQLYDQLGEAVDNLGQVVQKMSSNEEIVEPEETAVIEDDEHNESEHQVVITSDIPEEESVGTDTGAGTEDTSSHEKSPIQTSSVTLGDCDKEELEEALRLSIEDHLGMYDDRDSIMVTIKMAADGIRTSDDANTYKALVSRAIISVSNGGQIDEINEIIRKSPLIKNIA